MTMTHLDGDDIWSMIYEHFAVRFKALI